MQRCTAVKRRDVSGDEGVLEALGVVLSQFGKLFLELQERHLVSFVTSDHARELLHYSQDLLLSCANDAANLRSIEPGGWPLGAAEGWCVSRRRAGSRVDHGQGGWQAADPADACGWLSSRPLCR